MNDELISSNTASLEHKESRCNAFILIKLTNSVSVSNIKAQSTHFVLPLLDCLRKADERKKLRVVCFILMRSLITMGC